MITITDVLQRLGAVPNGDDKWIARCPLHQPDEESVGNWKLSILRGDKYPVLLFCYKCSEKGNRQLNLQVSDRVAAAIGVDIRHVQPVCGEKGIGCFAPQRQQPQPADAVTLDTVYSSLLDDLDFTDRHRRWIQKRGLDPDLAYAMGYRSTPTDSAAVTRLCWERWGLQLATVPGFYNVFDGDQVRCTLRPQAVLTPSRDCDGRIVALKQRMLDGGKVRMRLFGSGVQGGVRGVVNCHVPLGVGKQQWPTITVTEGERKADVYFQKTGHPTIGIPGLGLWEQCLPSLHRLSLGSTTTCSIIVALDQDGKEQTERARQKLLQAITDRGWKARTATWTGAKGIDDAVVKGIKIETADWAKPTISPSPQNCLNKIKTTKLADTDIVPYIRDRGRVHRCDLPLRHPNQEYLITKLIQQGLLRIAAKDHKGQVLETAGG